LNLKKRNEKKKSPALKNKLIVPLTRDILQEFIPSSIDPKLKLRGYAFLKDNDVIAVLPITPLEKNGWGSDGVIGSASDVFITSQLVQAVLRDLKRIGARIFIAFAVLPGLKPAGTLKLLSTSGREGQCSLVDEAHDDENFAELVLRCQENSQDFVEIPPCDDTLDPYRGYGDGLWRQYENKGVLMINPIDDKTNHLAFVGLVQSERGKGYGKKLIADALMITGADKTLTTAVDTRNKAACKLYDDFKFKTYEEKPVYFKAFPAK